MNPCVTGNNTTQPSMQGVLQQSGDGVPSPIPIGAEKCLPDTSGTSGVKGKEDCAGTCDTHQMKSTVVMKDGLASRSEEGTPCAMSSSEDPPLTESEPDGSDLETDEDPELYPGEEDSYVWSKSELTRSEGPLGSLEWCPVPPEELTKAFDF